ncbi:MAG: hypothetical protein ACOC44_12655 [Promethearchaeia archaeon]
MWYNEDEFSGADTYEGYSLAQDQVNSFKITDLPNNNNLSITLKF